MGNKKCHTFLLFANYAVKKQSIKWVSGQACKQTSLHCKQIKSDICIEMFCLKVYFRRILIGEE